MHVITTARLRLVALSPELLETWLGLRAGPSLPFEFTVPEWWPDEGARSVLEMRLRQLRQRPGIEAWLTRAVVDHENTMIGYGGFHHPPAPVNEVLDDNSYRGTREPADGGLSELGYTILEPFRRRGYATETVAGLLDWAFGETRLGAALASMSPHNAVSLRVLKRVGGWRQIGRAVDPIDGEEIVYRRDRPRGGPGYVDE